MFRVSSRDSHRDTSQFLQTLIFLPAVVHKKCQVPDTRLMRILVPGLRFTFRGAELEQLQETIVAFHHVATAR